MGPVSWTEEVPRTNPLPRVERSGPTGAEDPAAGWLDGVTVVDLTNVIAGPTIGSTLARYGARVIKVDLPEPTFDPWNTVLCGLHSNRGKQSVLLDVRSELGRPALRRLLARADVLTVNASADQLARLGLTGAELAACAPRAVLCHLDAWGGPQDGPWQQRSGYDDLVQAATGIMARFGGGLETPEEHAHFGTIDVLAGLTAAAATAFALYARATTGKVLVARSSLAAAGQLIAAPYLCDHNTPRPAEPSGPGARGEGPTYRLHATSDGWAFLVVPPDRIKALGLALGLNSPGASLEALPDAEVDEALASRLRQRTGEHWQQVLAPLGVTVQPLHTLAWQRERHTESATDAGSRPWSTSSYHFTTTEFHAAGRAVTLVAPGAVRPRTARIVVPADAPKYGEHTTAVLAEIGYDPDEITQMLQERAAGLSWSQEYLPS
jgi:crotonobetainyl-CoA:carnitine CoA-transferase CaiB-like acyl-CoA transferase